MSFYYEAEPPTWKYKERYGDWKKFPKRTGVKLEKLYKKIHDDGDTSVVEHIWKNEDQNTYKINLQTMSAQNQHSYYRNSDVSREGYPYPPPGNKSTLGKIHAKYMTTVDEDGEMVTFFDMSEFFGHMGIDPDGLGALIVLAMCEVDTFLDVAKKKFCDGLAKCGCSNVADIKEAIKPIRKTLLVKKNVKVLKSFARWLFVAAKEDSARTISTAQLSGLLQIMCPVVNFPLSQDFVAFLLAESEKEDGDRKTCSRDDWVMMVEFVCAKDSWLNFEEQVEDEGWPLIISECFENVPNRGEN